MHRHTLLAPRQCTRPAPMARVCHGVCVCGGQRVALLVSAALARRVARRERAARLRSRARKRLPSFYSSPPASQASSHTPRRPPVTSPAVPPADVTGPWSPPGPGP